MHNFIVNLLPVVGCIAAIVLHEAGHVVATLLCGLKVRSVGVCKLGFYVRRQSGTPAQNAVVALAGPAANVALAILWPQFMVMNIAVAIVCLLPLPNSDGRHFASAVRAMGRL